jgi:hypothetical protein
VDLVGLLAAACVLATFSMQSMIALRAFAIASNVLFIVYGAGSQLMPIVLLHAILLPVNGWSLGRQWGGASLALKMGFVTACWSGLLIGAMLKTDIAQAGDRVLSAVRIWFAY